MSLWSPKTLRIALAPGEVALHDGRSSRALTADSRSAMSLLPLVDEMLSDPAVKCRRAEVVLSQHFVRQVITPPPGKALSRTEEMALVTASLNDIYGDEAAGWRVAVHSQPPHAGLVGAAINAELVQQLEALLLQHGCRDFSIAPLASSAVRRLPARFDGWWLGVEPGWATLFGCVRGIWQHQAAQPIDGDWRNAMTEWLAREAECTAAPITRAVSLQPFGVGAVGAMATEGWRWTLLPHDAQANGAAAWVGHPV